MRIVDLLAILAATTTSTAAQLTSVELAYPPAELRSGVQGVVGFAVELTGDGRVGRCRVTETSGSAGLDVQTCRQLRSTGRFRPATDAAGQPIRSTYVGRLRWRLPPPVASAASGSPPTSSPGR